MQSSKYEYVVTPSGSKIIPVEEPCSKDEESPADYNSGGYLQVRVGDEFKNGRYRVVRKLGWGHFSTVWLVKDREENRHSALKVVKSAGRYAETARDEIKLLTRVAQFSPDHPGRSHIVSFLDSFTHQSPEASHICIVFEPLGENLLALIERNKKKGVPRALVKIIARQVLLALQYLHDECDLVHTDVKPENILISIPDVEEHIHNELCHSPVPSSRRVGVPVPTKSRAGVNIPQSQRPRRQVQIFHSQPLSSPRSQKSGFTWGSRNGSKRVGIPMKKNIVSTGVDSSAGFSWKNSPPWKPKTALKTLSNTAHSRSMSGSGMPTSRATPRSSQSDTGLPELLDNEELNGEPPISIKIADLGNATPSKKHYTEDIQTRQYRAPEAILGRKDWDATADIWSVACVVFELLTAEYLFDPQSQGDLFTKDDDHMAQIIELLGDFEVEAKMGGKYSRELFDHNGSLRYIKSLKPWPLKSVMMQKYLYTEQHAKALCEFLEPMLVVDFKHRRNARDMVDHPWLEVTPEDDVVGDW
ncbi:kinase-like protein [Fistulina hepatica ATCC 64428]|uniref:non-specific serine/threonine protein kinase n=1 Tax=Fistulina hepatica ATCC 64428 TaxID=1128425 RepID=A0A0D7AHV6_9AGAR|nr:kinase-like protein [Fistulina hepatica ATCC 64428]